jgi:hypothetical protein
MKTLGIFCAVFGLVANVSGFSLLGPYKPWMTETLTYRQPGDIGGPMVLGEGYRWNLSTITYGFDQSFLDYFGEEGVRAVEDAFAILNALPPMSEIDLDAYPTNTTAVSFEAQSLGYVDLKSYTLAYLLQQLGLAEPSRFTWAVRARQANATSTNHAVMIVNYDPTTLSPVTNVNGAVYACEIQERPNPLRVDAHEVLVDPFTRGWTAVADRYLRSGEFYTGLTRDDVGGLRFLLRTNNIVVEKLAVPVSLAPTNSGTSASWWPQPPGPVTNAIRYTAARPGVDKLNFVRLPLDTNLQRFISLTNVFVDTYYTNGQFRQQTLQRVITWPDMLFRSRDLGVQARALQGNRYTFSPRLIAASDTARWINHDDVNGSTVLGGPGVIPPGATIDFGRPDRYIGLGHPESVGQLSQWASFDGSTNRPVAFVGGERATTATISARIRNEGGGSSFEWTAFGIPDAVYRIESTTDFVTWSTVTTVTNIDGHFVCTQPVTTPHRFYRAVRQ